MSGRSAGLRHVPWSRSASLYPVNVRQFTPEGSFAAFQAHLPRIARMGVQALYLMPVSPIGERFPAFAVLVATLPGMPLIHGGQEAVLDKRLAFFGKDDIVWRDYTLSGFLAGLTMLKRDHPALWNGAEGGEVVFLPASGAHVVAFQRVSGGSRVKVRVKLSDQPRIVADDGRGRSVALDAWGYRIHTD